MKGAKVFAQSTSNQNQFAVADVFCKSGKMSQDSVKNIVRNLDAILKENIQICYCIMCVVGKRTALIIMMRTAVHLQLGKFMPQVFRLGREYYALLRHITPDSRLVQLQLR